MSPVQQPARPQRNRGALYRLAIIGGKGHAFPQPGGRDRLRDGWRRAQLPAYLENGNQPVNYRGSIATFFYNRQAVGRSSAAPRSTGAGAQLLVRHGLPEPALLPPLTPVFRTSTRQPSQRRGE
jgi:hypothetical protein